ncbi:MAG: O-antigen ligase family protein [Gammaproteobacteria bacterium]|nr:O-antigen ligase family protein [Gammaproteobacteria bacterium]
MTKLNKGIGVQQARKKQSNWPFVLVLLLVALEYLRPQDFFPFLMPFRIPGLVALMLIIYWLLNERITSLFRYPLTKLNMYFLFLTGISVMYAVNTFYPYKIFFQEILITASVVMPTILIVNSVDRVRKFLSFWVLVHLVLALIVLSKGGRGPGGFLSDENDVALALIMGLPYAAYMYGYEKRKKYKFLFGLTAVVSVLAIAVSFSRGGFLGLVCVLAFMWLISKNKSKYLLISMLMVVIAGSTLLTVLPEGYFDEMKTSTDAGTGTGHHRIMSWDIGLQMFYRNPVLGVGAGNYPWNVERYENFSEIWRSANTRSFSGRQSHSLYFTLIPEFGLLGIILYLVIFRRMYKIIRPIAKSDPSEVDKELIVFAKAIAVSIVGFLSAGAFISVLFYPHFWHLIANITVVANVYAANIREDAKE